MIKSFTYIFFVGGDPKELLFYNAFSNGFLEEYQHKILYILLNKIPKNYIEDGWLAEM